MVTFASTIWLLIPTANAQQTLTSNDTGTHDGFYFSFWKDSGNASFTLYPAGRYTSQWNSGTNKSAIEYYVIESYGSYNPASCSGGQDYGSFQSDGATYNVRRRQRVNQPSIEGTQTFYQYFSVRQPKKGFGNISGTITIANHFNYWASQGLNLGNHDYMVLATKGYQSTGSSDITVWEGSGGSSSSSGGSSSIDIVVRARGTSGSEIINLNIGGSRVQTWTLSTSSQNYTYSGGASGDIDVEYTNDASGRDVILDYVYVNGEARQAEDMDYNTATYGNGECGGGK